MCPGDEVYSTVAIVNNIALCISKLLREYITEVHQRKKQTDKL